MLNSDDLPFPDAKNLDTLLMRMLNLDLHGRIRDYAFQQRHLICYPAGKSPRKPETLEDVFIREAHECIQSILLASNEKAFGSSNGFISNNYLPRLTMQEKYRFQFFRLESFYGWPKMDIVSPLELARVGFVYAKKSDETICYLCSGKVRHWKLGADPQQVHNTTFPMCPISKGEWRGNVTFTEELGEECSQLTDEVFRAQTSWELHKRQLETQSMVGLRSVKIGGSAYTTRASERSLLEAFQPYRALPMDLLPCHHNNKREFPAEQSAIARQLKFYTNNYEALGNDRSIGSSQGTSRQCDRAPITRSQVLNFRSERFNVLIPFGVRGENGDGCLDMRKEASRLLTFHCDPRHYWPASHIVSPEELAREGFFYLYDNDRVQCAFCKGILRNWEPGDSASKEHRIYFPTCPYLMKIDVGNVPILRNSNDVSTCSKSYTDTGPLIIEPEELHRLRVYSTAHNEVPDSLELCAGLWLTSQALPGAPRRPVCKSPHATEEDYGDLERLWRLWPPLHVAMAHFERRRTSLEGVDCEQAHEIARAGFFRDFNGEGYESEFMLRCFWCDGGLQRLRVTDCPWLEHARWWPHCPWLLHRHGPNYVQLVHARWAPSQQLRDFLMRQDMSSRVTLPAPPATLVNGRNSGRERGATASSANNSMSTHALVEYRVEPREIKARMDLDIVRAVVASGLHPHVVRHILESRLRRTGDDYPDALTFMMACLRADSHLIELGTNVSGAEQYVSMQRQWEQMERDRSQQQKVLTGSISCNSSEPMVQPINNKMKIDKNGQFASSDKVLRQHSSPAAAVTSTFSSDDWRLCKICMDQEVNMVFLPCGHLCSCSKCAPSMRNCPICRAFIRSTVQTYVS